MKNITSFDIIRRPLVTEKTTALSSEGKVVFMVRLDASKDQIKKAIKEIYGVDVVAVNTVTTKGKVKRFRGRLGTKSNTKKAIITLGENQSLDIMNGVK